MGTGAYQASVICCWIIVFFWRAGLMFLMIFRELGSKEMVSVWMVPAACRTLVWKAVVVVAERTLWWPFRDCFNFFPVEIMNRE